jgi:hypothetical protein
MPKWVKVVLWVILALLLYLLPILNPPILSTPDTDFGGVLLTVTLYVLVASTSSSATPACWTSAMSASTPSAPTGSRC